MLNNNKIIASFNKIKIMINLIAMIINFNKKYKIIKMLLLIKLEIYN